MSQFYYLASARELPTGSFGKKKTDLTLREYVRLHPLEKERFPLQDIMEREGWEERIMEIYETELDAAGLHVSDRIQNDDFSPVFRLPIVYRIFPDGGGFHTEDDRSRKCLSELKTYLQRIMQSGEEAELFASWADGNHLLSTPRSSDLDWIGDLESFCSLRAFHWRDGQYLHLTKP